MHVGLMVHDPYKWYEYTHEWVRQVHNSNIRDNVIRRWLVMPELRKRLQKLCTWGLVVHNSQIRFKVMHMGGCGCIIPKDGTKLHKW